MGNWIIANKCIILIFVAGHIYHAGSGRIEWIVLFLLLYISLNMASCISKTRRMKSIWLGMAVVLVLIGYAWINTLFLMFLPVNLIELVFWYSKRRWLPVIPMAIPLFWLKGSNGFEYGLIGAFSYLIGLLANDSARRIKALNDDKDFLKEAVHRLGSRLKHNSDFEEQLRYLSQLEERNKIAQTIHDMIGHVISGSLIQLEAARLLMNRDPVKAKSVIEKVIAILCDGMANLRITLKNIKPAPEQLGVNRVKHILKEFEQNSQIKTALTYRGNLERISQVQWRILYENISEALTNVIKHAQATRVTVNIQVLNRCLKAEIKDNGCGAGSIKKGIGISGMEERSGNAGGNVIVDGSKGFSIITLLPLEGE